MPHLSWRVGLLAALGLSGCGGMMGMARSPERVDCLQHCTESKDDCVLAAVGVDQVHACDVDAQTCARDCPP